LVPANELASILKTIRDSFEVSKDVEITLEANPEGLVESYLLELSGLGINRLSLGMQSARSDELRLLERGHDYITVVNAVKFARRAGFDNLNLDLIFGLPYQTLQEWQSSLKSALDLGPEHISLYALTLEHGTPLAHDIARGLLPEPDTDVAAEMYEWSSRWLADHGYVQYEISNWARLDREGNLLACRHNLQYWRNLPYLGLGAGAHGYARDRRTANTRPPLAYIQRMQAGDGRVLKERFPGSPAAIQSNLLDQSTAMGETMFMGLRLTDEGVSRNKFQARFGISIDEVFGDEIGALIELGLLEFDQPGGDSLRLTSKGRLLGNQVFVRFV
jgi:oxygen-independent coproporphyrinogen-3 oxidase